jgi:Tol biopolymer transport system component
MSAFIVLAGSACGRIGFDPITSDANSGGVTPSCAAADPFTSITPVAGLDTSGIEGGLRLSADEKTAYFDSDRGGTVELWTATRANRDVAFDTPTLLLAGTNIYWPTVTADGLTLLYSDTTPSTYQTTRGSLAQPFSAGAAVTALGVADSPLLAGGDSWVFVTDRSAATPAIAVAPYGSFTPTDLTELGTAVHIPAVSDDLRVIYFSDTPGHNAVYVAERTDTTMPFGAPRTVTELASSKTQNPTWLSPDLCRLYFESDRTSNFDVYVAERALP